MRHSNISVAALCCSCCSFFFLIFPLAGVFMIWGRTGALTREPIFGTGAFVAGGLRIVDGANFTGFSSQRLTWDEVRSGQPSPCTNSASNNNMYSNWSERYGLCDSEDGAFIVPATVRVIQTFLVLNVVLLAVLVCLGCWHNSSSDDENPPPSSDPSAASSSSSSSPPSAPAPVPPSILLKHKKNAGYSAIVTLLATCSTVITFALIASTQWYHDLRDKGVNPVFMPLMNDAGVLVAVDVTTVDFVYGPTFVVLIICFLSTLVTLGLYTAMWHWPEMQLLRGFYGYQDDYNNDDDANSEPISQEAEDAKETLKGDDLESAAEGKKDDSVKSEQEREGPNDQKDADAASKTEGGAPEGEQGKAESATKTVHFA